MIASLGKRFLARFLDGILLSVINAIFLALTNSFIAFVLWVAVGIGYEIYFVTQQGGATLGKKAMGIRIANEADGSTPVPATVATRWVVLEGAFLLANIPGLPVALKLLVALAGFVVFLSPLMDSTKRNQGWHDKVAKTLVVSN